MAAPSNLGTSVLVVEDDPDAREALCDLLQSWGAQVSEAADGAEALRRIEDAPPDLALVDLGLPGIDGLEVARRARGTEQGRKPFLVALTGYSDALARKAAEDAGFDLHLSKPVDPVALEKLLTRRRRR